MRRIILFIFLFLSLEKTRPQTDKVVNLPNYDLLRYHYGFVLGINDSWFGMNPNSSMTNIKTVYSDPKGIGFDLGVVANLRLNNFIDLRFTPKISFNRQFLFYSAPFLNINQQTFEFNTTNLNIPLLFKVKYKRINNYRPYLIVGCKYRYNLSCKQTPLLTVPFIKLNDNDFCLEVGAGLDIYMTYFKFSPEINFSLGLQNLNQDNNTAYSKSIDKLTSRVIILYLYFE